MAGMKIRILALFLCAVFVGCSSEKARETSYPIGVMLPLEGNCAEASNEVIRGMEIACEKINASGGLDGIPVRLDVRNVGENGRSFLETFDSMRSAGVKVFNAGFGAECITKKNIVAKCDDVFVNFMCQYPPMTLDMPNCTRIFVNGAQVGDLMASAVKRSDESGVQLVVMNVDNFFGKADGDYLSFDLRREKTKLYRDVFGVGENRFDIFASQIMRLNADYVFYVGYGAELPAFTDSLSRAGFGKTVVANCAFNGGDFPVPSGVSLYRVRTAFELGETGGAESVEFAAAYKRKFGVAPTWKSAYGYDSIVLLSRALRKARFNPSKMRDCFKNAKYEGAVGKIEFDSQADSTSELSLVKM